MAGNNFELNSKIQYIETYYKLAQTIQILRAAGVPVDVKAMCEYVSLPLLNTAERETVGDLYQYHFQYGIVTVNEARARLGLPKMKGGDQPATIATAAAPGVP